MQLIRIALLSLLALAHAGVAQGAASAHLHFSGQGVDLQVDMTGSGATQRDTVFFVALDPGQTVDEAFTYTVTLSDEALPAERTWDFCTLVAFHSDCGPDPTGSEQAAASLLIARDRRSANGQIQDTVIFDHFHSVPGTATTFSGTIDYIATNTSDVERLYETVPVLAAVFVDASAVPESPAAVSMMSGLLWLLFLARRRCRGVPERDAPGRGPGRSASRFGSAPRGRS